LTRNHECKDDAMTTITKAEAKAAAIAEAKAKAEADARKAEAEAAAAEAIREAEAIFTSIVADLDRIDSLDGDFVWTKYEADVEAERLRLAAALWEAKKLDLKGLNLGLQFEPNGQERLAAQWGYYTQAATVILGLEAEQNGLTGMDALRYIATAHVLGSKLLSDAQDAKLVINQHATNAAPQLKLDMEAWLPDWLESSGLGERLWDMDASTFFVELTKATDGTRRFNVNAIIADGDSHHLTASGDSGKRGDNGPNGGGSGGGHPYQIRRGIAGKWLYFGTIRDAAKEATGLHTRKAGEWSEDGRKGLYNPKKDGVVWEWRLCTSKKHCPMNAPLSWHKKSDRYQANGKALSDMIAQYGWDGRYNDDPDSFRIGHR